MKKKGFPAWLVLLIICCMAGVLLAGTNEGTKGVIAQQEEQKAIAVRQELLTAAVEFQPKGDGEFEVYEGLDQDGNAVGYTAVDTVMGFGGEIEITVGTDPDGVLTGIKVGGAAFSETPGLGAKTKETPFQEQFTGKTYPLDLKKNGGEIDAVTAATISSSAVVRGVNQIVQKMADAGCFAIAKPATAVEELGDDRFATTKQGFGGPVYVEVTMRDGAITAIVIGDDRFSETSNYGAKAREEAFYGQYVGKSGTGLALGTDIDAVSGATITSTAVNDAVNLILLYVNDPEAYAASQQPAAVPTSFADGEYTVEANGVTSTFPVTVVIENNAVVSVVAGDTEPDSNDVYFLENCQTESFLSQFVGKSYPVEGIDAVSGATMSSKAILQAVNEAFEQAGK